MGSCSDIVHRRKQRPRPSSENFLFSDDEEEGKAKKGIDVVKPMSDG
jgi:hypothetical protein